jgi:hypothetical protein
MRSLILGAATCGIVAMFSAPGAYGQPLPSVAFASFVRVAATTGQPLASLTKVWPYPIDARRDRQHKWGITAAHEVTVTLESSGDSARVSGVRWFETVPDSASLRQRVSDIMAQLQRAAGPAELCSDPMGPPAYLFSTQHVERVWKRGLASAQTILNWDVLANDRYSIAVDVGPFTAAQGALHTCASGRP